MSVSLITASTEEQFNFTFIEPPVPFPPALKSAKALPGWGHPPSLDAFTRSVRTPLVLTEGLGPFIAPVTYYQPCLARELDSAAWVSPPQVVTPAPVYSQRGKKSLHTCFTDSTPKGESGVR